MPIPLFSFEQTVSQAGARHDKVEIGISCIFNGDVEEAEEFLRYLGAPPTHLRTSSEILPYGRFFNVQQGQPPRFQKQLLRVRTFVSGTESYTAPLLGGSLEIKQIDTQRWRVSVLASLNPTRFIRHQRMPFLSRPFGTGPLLELTHFRKRISGSYDGEVALCGNDNWLPDSATWQNFASVALWQNHLENCLTGLPETLVGELRRAASIPHASISNFDYNLRYVETYWEFFTNDPIGTVLELEPMLKLFSRRILATQDYQCTVENEGIENSRCLKLGIRNGETIKIYAKTNRRIRFEIAHHLVGNQFRVPEGGHTFSAAQNILPLVQFLSSTATRQVNRVLKHFRLHASVPENEVPVLGFISEIQAACEDSDKAYDLLLILTHNASLVTGHGIALGSMYKGALGRLTRRNVLHLSNGRYSITPPYRSALANMQSKGVGFQLGIRKRRRTH